MWALYNILYCYCQRRLRAVAIPRYVCQILVSGLTAVTIRIRNYSQTMVLINLHFRMSPKVCRVSYLSNPNLMWTVTGQNCYNVSNRACVSGIAQSVLRLATGLAIRGWLDKDFLHPSRSALGLVKPPVQWLPAVFPEGKAAGTWHWHPTPSSAEVNERVELYFYSLSGPPWPVIRWTLPNRACALIEV